MERLNLFFATITTISRLLSGFLLIFFLARILTINDFGIFTYSLVFSNILVLIVEYGYNIKLSKDTAKNPSRISQITFKAFKVKILLILPVLFILSMLNWIGFIPINTFYVLLY